jgi:hypothetical protein
MKKLFSLVAAIAVVSWASAASALTCGASPDVCVGWNLTGAGGGAVNVLGTSPAPGTASGAVTNANFTGSVNATGVTSPGTLLSNQSTVVFTNNFGGTAYFFATVTGVTAPLGDINVLSGFTVNTLTPSTGWNITESTYYSTANGNFALDNLLNSENFTALGAIADTAAAKIPTGPYSLTSVFKVTFAGSPNCNGACTANLTININTAATPIPAALPLFASGLGALGFAGWRKRKKAKIA